MKTITKSLLAFVSFILLFAGCETATNESNYCNNANRYNIKGATDWEATDVTESDAATMIQRFYDANQANRSPDDTVKGIFISKQALDSIFNDETLNGLSIYFAQTEAREYRLLMKGARESVITYRGGNTTPMLMAKRPTYCPPACGSIPPSDTLR